jgi:hypothetical protein
MYISNTIWIKKLLRSLKEYYKELLLVHVTKLQVEWKILASNIHIIYKYDKKFNDAKLLLYNYDDLVIKVVHTCILHK